MVVKSERKMQLQYMASITADVWHFEVAKLCETCTSYLSIKLIRLHFLTFRFPPNNQPPKPHHLNHLLLENLCTRVLCAIVQTLSSRLDSVLQAQIRAVVGNSVSGRPMVELKSL